MKRFLTLFAASALALTASAQLQIQNPSFEEWDNEETSSVEPSHWNSFMSGTGAMKGFAAAQQVQKSDDAHSGNSSARIYARSVFGVVAQGNLTTGCINMGSATATDANGNYNYTNEDDANFHQKFTGLPDAMRVWVKASCAYPAGASCNLHTTGYFQDPAGNTITAKRIAKANSSSIASSNDWQEVIIPFVYDVTDGTRPAYALITLTTSGTPGQGDASDWMLVDDVEFLYYSELQSITFNSKDIEVTGNNITIDGTYDEALLQLKSNGQGASITTSYNDANMTLTVTIKGDDIAANPNNQHTYTLTFTGKENEDPTPDPDPQPVIENYASLVPFGDFEAWKNECGTTQQTGSGGGDRQRPGSEPEGWNGGSLNLGVKLIATSDLKATLVEKASGINGTGTAVKMTNQSVSYWGNSMTFPGFVTYGNIWAWSGPTNFKNSDEGVYGGLAYTKRPDAVRGQFKRPIASGENAHIITYLWKGTFWSNIGAYDSPSTGFEDVDRAIMGHTQTTGGDGQLIASCDYNFESTKDGEWETITVPLTYVEGQEDAVPQKMNIIISSGDYWTRSIKEGSVLEADSIQFLFYSDLTSATFNGKDITFDENNHAVMDVDYAEELLQVTANGRSATVETLYDSTTRILTITVKGGNIDENPENFHTYTVAFPFYSDLTNVSYKGEDVIFDNDNKAVIDDDFDAVQLQMTPHDAAAIIEQSYDNATRILTITVKAANYESDPANVHTYSIEFLPQVKIISERPYTDQLQIKVNEGDPELQDATITMQEWNTGATSLVLKNFKLGSGAEAMNVGTIVVNDIQLDAEGKFQIKCNTTIQAGDDPAGAQWLGPVLGQVPLEINGQELRDRDVPDSLHVHILIDLKSRMGQSIDVLFGKSLIDQQGGKTPIDPPSGKITLPDHQDYEDDLIVTLNGNATAPQRTVISVDFHKNSNTLDLILKNFGLKDGETDMPVGTINVKGIPYTLASGVSYATFKKDVTVTIEEGDDPNVGMWMGPMLGDIPITLAGKAGTDKLYCTIDINMVGVGVIHVDFGTDANWPEAPSGGEDPIDPPVNPILKDRTYTDQLTVTVNGESSKPKEAQVNMIVNDDETVTLTLKNFYLTTNDGSSLPIGNIELTDITPVEVPNKNYYMFQSSQNVRIKDGDNPAELWSGSFLGEIPVTMNGKIAEGKLYCNISIYMPTMKENINVVFGADFTDGIASLTTSPVNEGSIYNLGGQRLGKLQKGINIVGGKKVLVK